MDLSEYIRIRDDEDSNIFWRLQSGDHQNLLDEAEERIAELEQERNLAEGRIDELEQENERLRPAAMSAELELVAEYTRGKRDGMERAAEIAESMFVSWRHDTDLHIGLGDIRVTIGMAGELMQAIRAELEK